MLFNVLKCVILMSLSGGLITLAILILQPLTKKFFSARWHYFVGIAALLLFLVPLSCIRLDIPPLSDAYAVKPNQPVAFKVSSIGYFSTAIDTVHSLPATVKKDSNTAPSGDAGTNSADAAACVYIAVAVIFAVFKLIKYIRFITTLNRNSSPVTCGRTFEIFGRVLEKMKIRRHILLFSCSGVGTPLFSGVLFPKIVVPQSTLNDDMPEGELRLIFCHELTHYRHWDMAIKLFVMFAGVVNWFNPLIYVLNAWLGRYSEMYCDESVVGRLAYEERKSYGNAILNSASFALLPCGEFSAALGSGKSALKQRLEHILSYKKSGYGLLAVSVCAALVITLSGCGAAQTVFKADSGSAVSAAKAYSSSAADRQSAKKSGDTDRSAISTADIQSKNAQVSGQASLYSAKIEKFMMDEYNKQLTSKAVYSVNTSIITDKDKKNGEAKLTINEAQDAISTQPARKIAYAVSDISLTIKGAIKSDGKLTSNEIADEIINALRDFNAKCCGDPAKISCYPISVNTSDSNVDKRSDVKKLADVFSHRNYDDQCEIPTYVLYLNENGQVCEILANDQNCGKAKSGINPIP